MYTIIKIVYLNVSFISSESDISDPRLSFVTTSLFDWLRSIGFVNYNTYGYYITFPNKETATNVYFNGTSSTSTTATAFPLSYTIAGAALVAYISEYHIVFCHSCKYSLDIALLVVVQLWFYKSINY